MPKKRYTPPLKVRIQPRADLKRSRLTGPLYIHKNSRNTDSSKEHVLLHIQTRLARSVLTSTTGMISSSQFSRASTSSVPVRLRLVCGGFASFLDCSVGCEDLNFSIKLLHTYK